ncbi:histone-lysine N-methyltransferase SETD1B isoform X1 [Selaginella moellendorffii]|uniref:histone-lysine N-methyltransferase SETD1B isoform X1 n=1 Tax=Selaginella moellendorffii TaxID=88036 RepID=UPI000D1CDEE2|nr:histone-lysine N-methyltransferase SETD1B isoform X1 [Selaginella moellendorffii]|eukprot:XP_024538609.1 histone-lysine N-methyltransferase SETD1B isoform X1 [Selaginella moellendorffii]
MSASAAGADQGSSANGIMKSFSKNSIRRGFFPEGAFNVRVASDPAAMARHQQHLDDSDDATPVLEVALPSDQHHHSPPSASKKPTSSTTSSSSSSSSRALFTFPSKWDDAEKWLKSSAKKSGKRQQIHGFKKLHQQPQGGGDRELESSDLIQGDRVEELEEDEDEEGESEDREKKMMIDSSSTSSSMAAGVVGSRFSFPMVKSDGGKALEATICEAVKNQQLRIQKPFTDPTEATSGFDFKQDPHQPPKSPTSLYESVACIAPGPRSISMRDMGTEMTPIASQEPSRTATPMRTPIMTSPGVSPGRLRPIPPPPPPPPPPQATTPTMPPNYRSTGTDASPPPPLPPPGDHLDEQLASIPALPATPGGATIHTTRNATRHEILVLGTQLGKSSIAAWATREEEENDASKCLKVVIQQQQQQNQTVDSLRPAVDLDEVRRTMVESRATAWEEAEHAKYMARYEREEAKILAWENHQKAKAEAELRRMEVKVERMRSHAHERMMNKLAAARRRAEELRAAAEAKRGEKAAKTVERASEIRRTGSTASSSSPSSSSHLFRCCLAGV